MESPSETCSIPDTNIHIGAWVLAGNVSRLYTWEAVGAYIGDTSGRALHGDETRMLHGGRAGSSVRA